MSAVFVLVHSPLVGPSTWTSVADVLRHRGVEALAPTLETTKSATAPYWKQHAISVAHALASLPIDHHILLVGHSGAGPLLSAIRQCLDRPVAGYLFVDAHLPEHGQNQLGTGGFATALRELYATGQQFPNWTEDDLRDVVPDPELRQRLASELRPQPWAFWEEQIPVSANWPDAPCAYLRFGKNPAYEGPAQRAREEGWPYLELDGAHFHMLVEPVAVANALTALAEAIGVTMGRGGTSSR